LFSAMYLSYSLKIVKESFWINFAFFGYLPRII
jgi:hypothetical protein